MLTASLFCLLLVRCAGHLVLRPLMGNIFSIFDWSSQPVRPAGVSLSREQPIGRLAAIPVEDCSLTIEFEGRETQAAESWRIFCLPYGRRDRNKTLTKSVFSKAITIYVGAGAIRGRQYLCEGTRYAEFTRKIPSGLFRIKTFKLRV